MPEIDLFGQYDGIEKCIIKEGDTNINTVGNKVKSSIKVDTILVYEGFDVVTKAPTKIVHELKNVYVTDSGQATPMLFDVSMLTNQNFRSLRRVNGQLMLHIKTSQSEREVLIPLREHKQTGLLTIPIKEFRKPQTSIDTEREKSNSEWKTVPITSNYRKAKDLINQVAVKQQHFSLKQSNRFQALAEEEENDLGNGISPLYSGAASSSTSSNYQTWNQKGVCFKSAPIHRIPPPPPPPPPFENLNHFPPIDVNTPLNYAAMTVSHQSNLIRPQVSKMNENLSYNRRTYFKGRWIARKNKGKFNLGK